MTGKLQSRCKDNSRDTKYRYSLVNSTGRRTILVLSVHIKAGKRILNQIDTK